MKACEMATASDSDIFKVGKVAIGALQLAEHGDIVTRAIASVPSTRVAEVTYEQIIDGFPLEEVAFDNYESLICAGHPLTSEHKELSSEASKRAGVAR